MPEAGVARVLAPLADVLRVVNADRLVREAAHVLVEAGRAGLLAFRAEGLAPAIAAAVAELVGVPVTQVRGHVTGNALREHERKKREAQVPTSVAATAPLAPPPARQGRRPPDSSRRLSSATIATRLAWSESKSIP
jgi:hypothetical protein